MPDDASNLKQPARAPKPDGAKPESAPRSADSAPILTERFPRDNRPKRSKDEVLEHLEEVVKRLRAQTLEMEELIVEARRQVRRRGPETD